MNVAVVDVAADSSGALSVLMDFYTYVRSNTADDICWYFFTSVVNVDETENIKNIKNEKIKKSWVHRLCWEYISFPKLVKKNKIDIVLSMQNKALPGLHIPQVVYFHNALHFVSEGRFSFWNKYERSLFLYRKLVTPITIRSLQKCDVIITQTETMKKELEARVPNKKIVVVPPDVKVQIHEGVNLIKGFIYPSGATVYKRHDIVINAAKMVSDRFSGSILFTMSIEDKGYAEDIRKLSEGVDSIKFVGFLNRCDLMNYYEQYGLIFSSDIESFPIPFVEAMAYGTPIIARDMPYAREILGDYPNAYFYKDCYELAHIFEKQDEMLRQNGRSNVVNLVWNKLIDVVLSIAVI